MRRFGFVHICAQKRLHRVNDNQPCVVLPGLLGLACTMEVAGVLAVRRMLNVEVS